MENLRYMLLNMPNPQGENVYREYAGGFGTLGPISGEVLLPSYLVYGTSAVEISGYPYMSLDAQAMRYNSSRTVEEVREFRPDILLTWASLPTLYEDLETLKEIKSELPETLIIVMGTVCNVMPEEVLKDGVDLLVRGINPYYRCISSIVNVFKDNPATEESFKLIDGAIYRKNGTLVKALYKPVREDLDEIHLQVYEQLPIEEYIGEMENAQGHIVKCIPIVTSVGCPYGCMYCPYSLGYGKKVTHKSIDMILEEMEYLKNKFGIKGFLFRDQVFTYNRKRVESLCNEIIERDLDAKWFIEARVDQVSYELLEKMRNAGCFRIHYGVETGAEEMLSTTGKPGLDLEKIKSVFQMTKEIGIFASAHIILGLPGESKETLENTLKLIYELNPDAVNLNIATPYPGTKLFETASENGWIETYDWSKYTSYDAIMETGNLEIEDLINARKNIKRKFRNFKLLKDSHYRNLYIKTLPQSIYYKYLQPGK